MGKFITPQSLDKQISPVEEEPEQDNVDGLIDEILNNNQTLSQVTAQISRNIEKRIIDSILVKVKYNKSKAATILGIDRKTLYSKIKELEISVGDN